MINSPIPEASMIPIIREHFLQDVNTKINPKKYTVGEEFNSQYGIPDLLFYNFNNVVLNKRMRENTEPVLSKDIIKTLLFIQKKRKVSLSFLQENLPFNKDALKNKIVKYLLNKNYLSRTLNDCETFWVGENIYKTGMDNVFAIEAKVSNWKRGFYQAYRYKWFSHYSFLAMHCKFIRPALGNIELFERYNIGLISVNSDDSTIEVLRNPRKEDAYSPEMAAMTFEKLFAIYLEKNADSQSAQSSCLTI